MYHRGEKTLKYQGKSALCIFARKLKSLIYQCFQRWTKMKEKALFCLIELYTIHDLYSLLMSFAKNAEYLKKVLLRPIVNNMRVNKYLSIGQVATVRHKRTKLLFVPVNGESDICVFV